MKRFCGVFYPEILFSFDRVFQSEDFGTAFYVFADDIRHGLGVGACVLESFFRRLEKLHVRDENTLEPFIQKGLDVSEEHFYRVAELSRNMDQSRLDDF